MRTATGRQGANEFLEEKLTEYLKEIEGHCSSDCLCYVGPVTYGADDKIREAIEDLPKRNRKLTFVLETSGGFAEVTRRISDALRHHYRVVDFLIPSYAMSAGTILAMSGDAIWMDYYSVLGPIDPQVPNAEGQLIPALGYLVRYEELLDKANRGTITAAELSILMNFDQGNLYNYEQARDLSVSLLEEWLVKYKFKDWKVTETTKKRVTLTMKKKRANDIAKALNDVKKWNSHGIGISAEVLRKDLNLKVDDYSANAALSAAVRGYHRLLTDYMARMRQRALVHTREAYNVLRQG